MTDPTLPRMFATAFPVPHHHSLDNRPCYWRFTAADGRIIFALAMNINDAEAWVKEVFPGRWVGAKARKMRTAFGTPPF